MATSNQRLYRPLAGAALLLLASVPFAAAEIYDSPASVQPLLIGSEVPSVDVLTLEGATVDLKEVVGDKKTVVIFYRGGW